MGGIILIVIVIVVGIIICYGMHTRNESEKAFWGNKSRNKNDIQPIIDEIHTLRSIIKQQNEKIKGMQEDIEYLKGLNMK